MLFNCAGIVASGTILETTRLDCDRWFVFNVIALFEVTRAVLPAMPKAGSGVIENMASGVSSVKGYTDCFAYDASKAAAI